MGADAVPHVEVDFAVDRDPAVFAGGEGCVVPEPLSRRDDVFALRWENARSGKAGWSPAVRGGWANSRNPNREYLPFSVEVTGDHLSGEHHAGLYPLLDDDSCWLLACDFDGPGWGHDALAYVDAARSAGVPASLERSRSGAGAHVWVFFAERVPATAARRIGIALVREAMTMRAELDLGSYDRLFPSQDFLPRKGFGNLIALPLQGGCRKKDTTVFLEPSTMAPYADQWEYLSSVERTDGLVGVGAGREHERSGDWSGHRHLQEASPTRSRASDSEPHSRKRRRHALD